MLAAAALVDRGRWVRDRDRERRMGVWGVRERDGGERKGVGWGKERRRGRVRVVEIGIAAVETETLFVSTVWIWSERVEDGGAGALLSGFVFHYCQFFYFTELIDYNYHL